MKCGLGDADSEVLSLATSPTGVISTSVQVLLAVESPKMLMENTDS